MTLLIDNYDSFSYNLYQLIGSMNQDIMVIRNDFMTLDEIKELKPDRVVLSPGPGYPKDAGICEQVVEELKGQLPILGVCLGHQAICEVFGGNICHAEKLMHGKQSRIHIDNTYPVFLRLPEEITAARYHSLIARRDTLPECLKIIAEDERGQVMGVKHKHYDIYGLQFHPESILTPDGRQMIENFLSIGGNRL